MKYIYILRDPIDKKVRYVGATKNPKQRFKQHLKDAEKQKKTGKTKKQLWILGLKKQKITPKIEIIGKNEDIEKARIIEEQEVMRHIDTIYNIHMPGKGSLSVKHYKDTGKLHKQEV